MKQLGLSLLALAMVGGAASAESFLGVDTNTPSAPVTAQTSIIGDRDTSVGSSFDGFNDRFNQSTLPSVLEDQNAQTLGPR